MDGLGVIALGALVLLLTPIVARDMAGRRVPDLWLLALGGAGFVYGLLRGPAWSTAFWTGVQIAALLAALVLASFLLRRLAPRLRLESGDIKMLVAASPWVGLEGIVAVLVVAGLLLAVATALSRRSGWSQARPFVPILAAGLFLVAVAVEFSR